MAGGGRAEQMAAAERDGPELSPVDRSAPPAAATPRPFDFPDFRRLEPVPGLDLRIVRIPRLPLAHLRWLAPGGGAWHDPPELAGLASLTGDLLDQGTERRSAPEIAAAVERLGGYLASSADWDAAQVLLGVLAAHLEPALELLAEVATSPTFPAEEVVRVRRQRLADLLRRRDQPAALAADFCALAIYGDSVYGRGQLGTPATIERIDRAEIHAFHRRHLHVRGTTLIAAGDLDPGRLAQRVADAFGALPTGEPPTDPEVVAPVPESLTVHVVDRPQAAQTELRIGHAGVARDHPDFLALRLLNSIFGGKFTSRINLNLRERHGFTYGAHSRWSARRGPGPFVVATAVASENAGAAVREILHEIERLRDAPVDEEELRDARNYLLGVFPYTVQTLEGLASRLEELALFSLPDDYFRRYPEILAGIDRDRLLAVARAHLRPAELAVVAVGPADVLGPQLEPFAEPRVVNPSDLDAAP